MQTSILKAGNLHADFIHGDEDKSIAQNMMSTKCSSHFIEAYGEYKRSVWRSQEDERLKQLRVNGRFVMTNYEDDDREGSTKNIFRPVGTIYDQISMKNKCPQIDALIEEENEDDNKDSVDTCVWQAELKGKRQSIYTASLSASHLERLQQLSARRNTLPDNVFSQLRDKCSKIQSRRVLPTVAYEEEEEEEEEEGEEENNVPSDEYIAEEEANLPEETKLLIRRSRQLSAAMQNKPRERQTKFEEIMSMSFDGETSEKISLPNIKSRNNRIEYSSRHMMERRRNSTTKAPLVRTGSNERNKIDINETPQSCTRRVSHSANTLPSQSKRNCNVTLQTDNNNNNNMYTKTGTNHIPSDVNISYPKRSSKFVTNVVYNVKVPQHKVEKKTNLSIDELKSCRYLRQEVMTNTCTCNTCERRKTICKNCKTNKQLDF